MLFRKKKQEECIHKLDEIKRQEIAHAENLESLLKGRMDSVAEAAGVQSARLGEQLDALVNRMDELQKMQKRQVQSLEDFLEEEEDRADREENQRQKAQADKGREAHLLSLVECYQEQLHLLRRQIREEFEGEQSKAASWEKQFEIVEECLARQRSSCALEQVGKEQEPVDFECHQVLKVINTEDSGLDSRVAEVFCPGFIYHGKVIKKAQVSAYRRIKDGNSDRD